jgi:integrase
VSWVEKLPSGRYRAKYRGEDGRQHSQTFPSKAAAKAFLHSTGADMQRGQWVDPRGGQMLFRDWAAAWSAARVVRPTTHAADAGRLRNHLLPAFGDGALKDITPMRVRSWVAQLSRRRAPATVRHCHAMLSQMLADAVTEGLLLTNPCRGTRLPRPGSTIAQFLAPEQVERLVEAVEAHYRPLVVVAVTTGMRWGELVGLRPQYVDLLHRRLRVVETLVEVNGVLSVGQPKTPRSCRTISLPAQAVTALEDAMAGPARDYVFVTEAGFPIRRHNFSRRVWTPALAAAGLDPSVRFHDLRHTHVALLIAAGVPVKAIQDRLGHTSIVTTMDRYGHLLASVDESVITGLETQLPLTLAR